MRLLESCFFIFLITGFTSGEIKNKGWWKNTVFYQVYPRSFMDANNDGIGDLQGITSKLEYIRDSGIDAIWLSPIYASPMIDFGYDISDFRDIDDAYGSLEDLEALTAKARKLGIKVIMDFVPNHTSDQHYWFIQSNKGIGKYKDYYVWRKGQENNSKPPNNWISVFTGPAWTYSESRDMYYLHQFERRQPDLNYTNPYVRQEMEDVLKFWLSKGIDGFRIDATPYFYETDGLPDEPLSHIPGLTNRDPKYLNHIHTKDDPRSYELIKSWRKVLDEWSDSRNEDEKVIMTEAYTNLTNTIKYYKYGSNVPFNFMLATELTNSSKPSDYKKVIETWTTRLPENEVANWVVGNHDRSRIGTLYPGRSDQMTILTMVLPGVAVTYNGDEIGMVDKSDISWEDTQDPQACNADREHYQILSRDPVRTPFQWDDSKNAGFSKAPLTWLPVNDNYKELNLAKEKTEPQSHYKLYQTLTQLKHTSEALKSGDLTIDVLNDDSILAVARRSPHEAVVFLINFSDTESQKINASRYFPGVVNATVVGSGVGSNIKWGTSVKVSDVKLPPKASVVISAKIN